MERLTSPNINVAPGTDRFLHAAIGGKEIDWKQFRDSTLNVLINGPTSNGFGKDIFRKMVRDLYGRLKAYEDTGLEPEEVTALGKLFDYALKESKTLTEQLTLLKHIRKLAEADKEGRCIIPPCKVGETVYFVNAKQILEFAVVGYAVDETGISWVYSENVDKIGNTNERTFSPDRFGKNTFFTREEAEKALQEMEGKKDG